MKYPLFLSDFNETLNFLDILWKKSQISNFIKICPVGVELLPADGHEAKVANPPKVIS